MTSFNSIKLNASQELQLKKARADFFGKEEPLELDKKSGLLRQKIQAGRPIFLEPLLCLLPEGFAEEEFRALESLEIFSPKKACVQDCSKDKKAPPENNKASQAQEAAALYYFPAIVASGGRQFQTAIPCAFGFELAQNFDLQKIFAAAQSAALIQEVSQDQKAATQSDADKKSRGQDLVLTPTSFYFARAEISQNTWSLYDALWKKLL